MAAETPELVVIERQYRYRNRMIVVAEIDPGGGRVGPFIHWHVYTRTVDRDDELARGECHDTLTDRELRSVLAEHGSEASIEQIARRFTLTVDRVQQIWRDAKLPPRSSIPSITINAASHRARAKAKAEGGHRGACRDCGREGLLVHRNGSRKGWVCPDRAACREARGVGRETEAA